MSIDWDRVEAFGVPNLIGAAGAMLGAMLVTYLLFYGKD